MNRDNAKLMAAALLASDIKNEHLHIGIMCVIAKECGFELVREKSYRRTSIARIRKIFPTRTSKLSDKELTALKWNDRHFFNHVYGGKLGNNRKNDGYNFRGGGWPQLTGKGNWKKHGPEWCDIVDCPGLMNVLPSVAASTAVNFYDDIFLRATVKGNEFVRKNWLKLRRRHGSPINDAIGVKWAANVTAGIGHGPNSAVVKRATRNASKQIAECREIYDELVKSVRDN